MATPQAIARQITGTVIHGGKRARTIKVRMTQTKWNKRVQKTFQRPMDILVNDPRGSAREGDIVTFSRGPRTSKRIRHILEEIVTPFGTPLSSRSRVPTGEERTELLEAKRVMKDLRQAGQGRWAAIRRVEERRDVVRKETGIRQMRRGLGQHLDRSIKLKLFAVYINEWRLGDMRAVVYTGRATGKVRKIQKLEKRGEEVREILSAALKDEEEMERLVAAVRKDVEALRCTPLSRLRDLAEREQQEASKRLANGEPGMQIAGMNAEDLVERYKVEIERVSKCLKWLEKEKGVVFASQLAYKDWMAKVDELGLTAEEIEAAEVQFRGVVPTKLQGLIESEQRS